MAGTWPVPGGRRPVRTGCQCAAKIHFGGQAASASRGEIANPGQYTDERHRKADDYHQEKRQREGQRRDALRVAAA